ncbi:phage tail protein [Kiloniella sp. b19]|uniref:phage tail protein n=1 Tax=Kiloniella sp. GXU_MW_B19 TaxID=3141326 RepID=UPI0031D94E9D
MSGLQNWSSVEGRNDVPMVDAKLHEIMAAVRCHAEEAGFFNPGHTPSRVSEAVFSVAGDKTGVFLVGQRIRITDDGSYKYGIITASVFNALTMVTVSLDEGLVISNKLSAVAIGIDPRAYVGGLVGSAAAVLAPVGSLSWHAGQTAPEGWLACEGQAVSRTDYAGLFAVIGTVYGSGDGSTTFNLPDLRGEFVRGWDNGRGVDAGRAFGSAQADELKEHDHRIGLERINASQAQPGSGIGVGADNERGTEVLTTLTGGSETRPRNVALLPIIRF